MAAVGAKVFAVEGIGLLAQSTRRRLDSLYFHDVIVQRGDGKRGWEEHAPFDAILVSCAVPEVGRELMSQLIKPTGRLVAPIGTEESQTLTLFEVRPGGIATYQLEPCSVEEDTSEERAER